MVQTVSGVLAEAEAAEAARNSKRKWPKSPGVFGHRHGQLILMSTGILIAYALRVNMSVGIVAMKTERCQPKNSTLLVNWTSLEQGLVLSAFFWGYGLPQVPLAYLASKMSPTSILAIAMFLSSLTTVVSPWAAVYDNAAFMIATRVIIGACQACLFPCVNSLLARWAIPQERERFCTYVFGGAPIGSFLMTAGGGLLALTPTGWPMIFYVSGVCGILWSLLLAVYGADSPEVHKTITNDEKDYIAISFGSTSVNTNIPATPWKSMLISVPFWALVITHCCSAYGYWTLVSLTPSYINGVLNFHLEKNGLVSATPYLANWCLGAVLSPLSDLIYKRGYVRAEVSRKLWNTIALYGEAACLLILALAKTNATAAVALIAGTITIHSLTSMGYLSNSLDLSPNYAGTVQAVSNTVATVPSLLGPLISSVIVTDMSDDREWKTVFFTAAVVLLVGSTTFIMFGSTDIQQWNSSSPTGTNPREVKEKRSGSVFQSRMNGISSGIMLKP